MFFGVSRGLGKAADQMLNAGRSIGVRVPATKCDIPLFNRAFNWCFTKDTLVLVCGVAAVDALTPEPALVQAESVDASPGDEHQEIAAASLGAMSPADVAAGAIAALGVASVVQARRKRRSRATTAQLHDRMLGHAEERDFVPDAVTDDLVLVGCAQRAESPSRDLAHESALAAWVIDEASAAAKSSSRAKRRASTSLPKTPMPRIADRRVAVNSATPRSRVERSLEAAADRARVLRTPRRPLRHERLLEFVASGPALAIWFIVAVTAWWLLPKSWDGGDAVARRRPAPSSAGSFAGSSELLNDVTAAARPSREELLQRAEADPLSVQAYKRIDEIREGDLVVALDENSGELVARPVTRLFRNTSDHLREVKYQTADGEERRLETTDEHPFWTARGGWTPAKDLRPGDEFRQANGDDAILLATLYVEEPDGVAVYNFEVDGAHNYFVAAPNTIRGPPDDFFAESRYADTLHGNALLVHNRCTTVYRHVDDAGKVRYVGISYASAFAARTSYHRRVNKFDVVKLFDVATRRDARAVEQALINLHVLGRKGGSLLNKINSISPTRKWYDDALKRGMDILRANGYKHPGLL